MKLYSFRNYVIAVTVVYSFNREKLRQLINNLDEINAEIEPNEVQLFNADNILDETHLKVALVNAVMSFNSPNRVAKTLRMEILLKLSATDQIREAIAKLGVAYENTKVGIIGIAYTMDEAREIVEKIKTELGNVTELKIPELSGERATRLAMFYGISREELESTQASNHIEALKLALAHRIATTRL